MAREQRRRIEIQNRQAEGELIAVYEVEEKWAGVVLVTLRTRLLALPAWLAPRIFGASSRPIAHDMQKKIVNEVLAVIHGDVIRSLMNLNRNNRIDEKTEPQGYMQGQDNKFDQYLKVEH